MVSRTNLRRDALMARKVARYQKAMWDESEEEEMEM
jgi:hypothetical protein